MGTPVLELEGTWEEIEARHNELRGHYLRVTAFDPEADNSLPDDARETEAFPSNELMKRYPSALEAEYDSLVRKKLLRTLTEAEAIRLLAIRNVIAEIDRLTNPVDIREQQTAKLREELAQIRAELEALPDA